MIAISRQQWANSALARVARYGFLACAFAAGALLCWRERDRIAAALAQTSPSLLLLAFALGAGHVALSFFAWRILLDGHGARLSWRAAARMFFLGQIGKYLPGGVWPFLAVAEFGRDAGLNRRTALASQMLALVVSLCAAAAIGLATVPQAFAHLPRSPAWLLLAAIPLGVLLLPRGRKLMARAAGTDFAPTPGSLLASVALAVLMWGFAGAQLVLLANAVGQPQGWADLLPATGTYAVSWTAGFLFLVAPAGIGAREAVLVALLSANMPLPQALIVALLSRIAMTLADFAAAAATVVTTRAPAAQ